MITQSEKSTVLINAVIANTKVFIQVIIDKCLAFTVHKYKLLS